MILLPAIDVKDGQCVRLLRGDFATAHRVAEDAEETARSFRAAGAEWIHLVDLDGAKAGAPRNAALITAAVRASGLKSEVGGGIRTRTDIESYLEAGITRVILGSAALRDPAFTEEAVRAYGERIAVGIDARDRMVSADGWLDDSTVDFVDLARRMEQIGVRTLIYTDIARDGTLSGPNLAHLTELNAAVSCDVVASGGVRDLADVRALRSAGLAGAICGKSIYEGTLRLDEAVRAAREEHA